MSLNELEIQEIEEALISMEKLRNTLTQRLHENKARVNFKESVKESSNSKCSILNINNYSVYQFSYDGMLPAYIDNTEYKESIRSYYFHETMSTFSFSETKIKFKESVIIFVQYFKNKIIRDLENRNKKFIQDAIRMLNIIEDDSWFHVWNIDIGLHDPNKDHVQVYVVERDNVINLLQYLEVNHERMMKEPSLIRRNFIEEHHSEQQRVKKQKKQQHIKSLKNLMWE